MYILVLSSFREPQKLAELVQLVFGFKFEYAISSLLVFQKFVVVGLLYLWGDLEFLVLF